MSYKDRIRLFFMTSLFIGQGVLYAQNKSNVKFGKITPADFSLSGHVFDSSAGAVVIADIGSSLFQGNTKGGFSIEFRHFKRIKILKKEAIDHNVATYFIPLYTNGQAVEKLEGLKASTYNLEDGKVVETKLDAQSLFTENASKNWVHKKFTFPAVKEGSIVEFSYIQTSDFIFDLQPWAFQSEYPCLWSEYTVDIPNFYQYVFLSQGYVPFDVNSTETSHTNFSVTLPGGSGRDETVTFDDDVVTHHWVMKNVPALKEESYTTTLKNHIAKIEFQLNLIDYPRMAVQPYMENWPKVCEKLMESDYFGGDINRNNGWLDDDLKTITGGAANDMEKARRIYDYVRDHFTCTNYSSYETEEPIKTVFKNKSGSVAGLNLLLAAMLIHEKIGADPIILSTRANGYTHPIYPLLDRYNYVILRVKVDTNYYLLDASEPWMGFGHIPGYCYNGQAQLISTTGSFAINLTADAAAESKTTMVFLSNDGSGKLTGNCITTPGYFESARVRQEVHERGEKAYFSGIQSRYTGGIQVMNPSIDSLKRQEDPVKVGYDFSLPLDTTEDILYVDPILGGNVLKENPFKAAVRKYPVEMPNPIDETYILNMEVPAGDTVEELPKSTKVLFNTDEGFFLYLISTDGSNIQLQMRIKLVKANYQPEDYAGLRDFFAYVVKKEGEQIVFKRKK